MKTAIVVTTIYEPQFLPGYLSNIQAFDHRQTTTFYVIPDRKTPASVGVAAAAAATAGFLIQCPDLDEQTRFLSRLEVPPEFVPWNSDNRRNIGFLMALADGCDAVISIDDDNFCPEAVDFVGTHTRAVGPRGPAAEDEVLADGAGWFNPCAMLRMAGGETVFPRGYPYKARMHPMLPPRGNSSSRAAAVPRVTMNAGLWLADPDVDAVTRLAVAPRAIAFEPPSVVLGPDAWMPIDSQNTALTREAMAAYYYVRMGYPVRGLVLDRFGDIFSGYFAQKCAKHLAHAVRVGTPIAEHRRSPHDLVNDLFHELAGIALLEDLAPWLREEKLEGSTYGEVSASLAEHLDQAAERFRGTFWEQGGCAFLRSTADNIRTWLAAVRQVI